MNNTREKELIQEIKCLQKLRGRPQDELGELDKRIFLRTLELRLVRREDNRRRVGVEERKQIVERAIIVFLWKKKTYPMLTYYDMARFLMLLYFFVKHNGEGDEVLYTTMVNNIKVAHSEWHLG